MSWIELHRFPDLIFGVTQKLLYIISSVPILEFKGSVHHFEKGHPTLVTQVDLILWDWWEFKVLMTVTLNSLSGCLHLLWLYCSFNSLFPIWDFEPPGDGRRRNLKNFYVFFFKKVLDMPSPKCRIYWKDFLKIQ